MIKKPISTAAFLYHEAIKKVRVNDNQVSFRMHALHAYCIVKLSKSRLPANLSDMMGWMDGWMELPCLSVCLSADKDEGHSVGPEAFG